MDSSLQNPYILFLFLPLLVLFFLHWKKKTFFFPLEIQWDRNLVIDQPNLFIQFLEKTIPFASFIGIALVIYAASSPGQNRTFLPDETDGIDIMIALDISGSMVNSFDFLPKNRLSVSKDLLKEFVKKRQNDRIGLVLFAGAAYLQSPLTSDRNALQELIEEAEESKIDEQGTAIGDALVLATYRLKSSKAKSKVILLLTDGVSNTGKLDPETASFTTKAYEIKVYSIGIGKETGIYETNYESLQKISQDTGGKFFRAETPDSLLEVLEEIDRLEVSPLPAKPTVYIESEFQFYLFWALFFFALDFFFRIFPLRHLV